jgi:hypothetical protein
MQSILILAITFTLLELSHSECRFDRGFTFPVNYECRIDIGSLNFQTDGNLVIYDGNRKAMWSTGTSGRGENAVFQSDGNFVIYDIANRPVWNSNTVGTGRSLIFQNDRNLVIYDNANRAVWSSKTTF